MKTTMQELKDIIENHDNDNIPKDNLLKVINLMSLEKEKQQIIDAYDASIKDPESGYIGATYYNNTFNENT